MAVVSQREQSANGYAIFCSSNYHKVKNTIALMALFAIIFASCKKKESPKTDPKASCNASFSYECTYNVYNQGKRDSSLTAIVDDYWGKDSRRMSVSINNRYGYIIVIDCETKDYTIEGQPGKVGKIYADSLEMTEGDRRTVLIPRRN